jgi:hypothetical protein
MFDNCVNIEEIDIDDLLCFTIQDIKAINSLKLKEKYPELYI